MGADTNGKTKEGTCMKNDTRINHSAPVTPVISINKHGYQRITIQAKRSLYPLNTKIDKASHDHLMTIKAYYDRITGLNVRDSVIMRRAIELLGEHLRDSVDPKIEQDAIVRVAHHDA